MKLKILKEILWENGRVDEKDTDGILCENMLRNEAIKWIKELDKVISGKKKELLIPHPLVKADWIIDKKGASSIKLWIRHFFGISDKDLRSTE